MVWSFAAKSPYPTLTGAEVIDGGDNAVTKLRYLHPEEVGRVAMLPGARQMSQGVRVVAEDAPKKVCWMSTTRAVPDYITSPGGPVVSERLRDLIEQFEPGVHQFIPVDLYRPKAKAPFATHYWFVVCSRIDSVDAEHSTMVRSHDGPSFMWMPNEDYTSKMVFSVEVIGDRHIWCDPRLVRSSRYISNQFHDALLDHGMTGISGMQFEQV